VLSKRKVILFAYYYLPDNTSGVQRAVRMARYLPEHGYDTLVIASSHAGAGPVAPGVCHVPTAGDRARSYQAALARFAQRIVPYNERLEWVPHAIRPAKRVISGGDVGALISTSPPLASHFAALLIKMRYGLKWIADFRDPLVGNPGRPRDWAKPYDAWLERLIFRNADAAIAVTDAVAEEWRRRYPRWATKFHVIWNGFDPEGSFGPEPLPQRSYRAISHIGVLYSQRHPTALVDSLARLVSNGLVAPHTFRLRFIGPIQEQEIFTAHFSTAALIANGCLEIRGQLIPRAEAMHEIATADFLLLIDIVNLSNAGYTVPAKLYDYILAGRPILAITARNSPVDRILTNCGILNALLYHDDPAEVLDRKLVDFLKLPTEPLTPSAWFLERFDGRRQAALLAALLEQVLVQDHQESIGERS